MGEQSPRAPGAMTSLMRAFPEAAGPQVLRLARVEAQKVVDERLHKGDVLVGDSPHATLHLDRPPTTLFVSEKDGWALALPDGVRARVATSAGPEELVGPARRVLPRGARGRVSVGATQLLFQLVAAPPRMPAPQLPLTMQSRGGVDWAFLCIAAASFLAHFGFVGVVQADWLDPIVDDEGATAALIVEAKKRNDVPVEDPQKPILVTPDKAPKDEKVAKVVDDGKGSPVKGTTGPASPKAPSTTNLSALDKELDDLDVAVLGSMGAGQTVSSVMKKGDKAVDAALDEVAKKNTGVNTDGTVLKEGGNPVTGPIAGTPGLAKLGDPKGKAPGGPGTTPGDEPKGPTVVPAEPQAIPPPSCGGCSEVIPKWKWRFKACYAKELAKNPEAAGTVKVAVETDADGKVLSAAGVPSGSLSPAVALCVANVFYSMKFGESAEGMKLNVPVILNPAK